MCGICGLRAVAALLASAHGGSALRRSFVRLLFGFSVGLLAIFSFSSTALAIDEFPAPGSPSGTAPRARTAATLVHRGDGNKIGRMTTGGAVTDEFPIPTRRAASPSEITAGPTDCSGSPSSTATRSGGSPRDRHDHRVPVPVGAATRRHRRRARRRHSGSRESGSNQIGRISTAGADSIDEFPLPSAREPGDITVGPDNRLWFTRRPATRSARSSHGGSATIIEYSRFRRRKRPVRDHRDRRRAVVHRVRRQQDRPDQHHRA